MAVADHAVCHTKPALPISLPDFKSSGIDKVTTTDLNSVEPTQYM
jgi:hypothetical protein